MDGPEAPPAAAGGRLRIRYAKRGKIRFTSHRDVVRMWERALRRSGLPVVWSEGFSPHPLLSFGLALPTGAESLAEYLDVTLRVSLGDGPHPGAPALADAPALVDAPALADPPALVDLPALADLLSELLPDGIDVQALATVPLGSGSLQGEVSSCSWELEVLGLPDVELATRVERLLASPSVLVERTRKGRAVHDDLRPSVLALAIAPSGQEGGGARPDGPVRLDAELATRPRGVRPRELLAGLGPEVVLARACRSQQWIERDGMRWEPLALGAGSRPSAEAPACERVP